MIFIQRKPGILLTSLSRDPKMGHFKMHRDTELPNYPYYLIHGLDESWHVRSGFATWHEITRIRRFTLKQRLSLVK